MTCQPGGNVDTREACALLRSAAVGAGSTRTVLPEHRGGDAKKRESFSWGRSFGSSTDRFPAKVSAPEPPGPSLRVRALSYGFVYPDILSLSDSFLGLYGALRVSFRPLPHPPPCLSPWPRSDTLRRRWTLFFTVCDPLRGSRGHKPRRASVIGVWSKRLLLALPTRSSRAGARNLRHRVNIRFFAGFYRENSP